jgi:hypothetical protein
MTTVTSLYNCPCSGAFPVGGQAQNYANGYAGVASVGAIGPPGMQTPVQFRVFESASFSQQPQVAVLPYSPSTIVGATPIYYNTNGAVTAANGGNITSPWGVNGGGNAGGSGNINGSGNTSGNNGLSGNDLEFDQVYTFCANQYGPCAYKTGTDFTPCVESCIQEKTNIKPPTSLATVAKPPGSGNIGGNPGTWTPSGSGNIGGNPNTWGPSGSGNIGGNPGTWGPVNPNYPPGYYPTPPPYGFRANECGCARTAFSQLPPAGFLAWEPLIRRFNEPFNSLAGLTCQGRLW